MLCLKMGCPEIQYVSSTLSSFPTCFKIIKIILPPPHIILNIPMALWPHQVKWSFILLTNPPCFVGEGFLANPAWWASRHGQTRAWHLAPPVFTNSWMDQNPELAGWWFRGTPTWQLGKLHVFFPCFFSYGKIVGVQQVKQLCHVSGHLLGSILDDICYILLWRPSI